MKNLQTKSTIRVNAQVCLLALSTLLSIEITMAQNKVVVIPMSGDNLRPLANIVTVAKQNGDFDSPLTAMISITDATAATPYLLVIAPGVYELGRQQRWPHSFEQ